MVALEKIKNFEEKLKGLTLAKKPLANDEDWRFCPSPLWKELSCLQTQNSPTLLKKQAGLLSLTQLKEDHIERLIELMSAHPWEQAHPFLQKIDQNFSQTQVLLVKGEDHLDKPVILDLSERTANSLPAPLVLIFDKYAKARVIIHSKNVNPTTLVSLRIIALEHSSAYVDILEETHGTWAMFEQVILLDKAQLKHSFLSLGRGKKKRETTLILKGRDSLCHARSAYYSTSDDYKEMLIRQHHLGEHSESLVLEKGVVAEKAYNVLNGIIKVFPNASFSQAYLTNNNLHLNDGARSHSVPRLEIQENEVKCSHSSTACLLDSLHLFYMRTRGLSNKEAKEILTRSFLEEALQEAHETLIEKLTHLNF